MPSSRAAKRRPGPATTLPSRSIKIGTLKPKVLMLWAICRICFLLWQRGLLGSGFSWSIGRETIIRGARLDALRREARRSFISESIFAVGGINAEKPARCRGQGFGRRVADDRARPVCCGIRKGGGDAGRFRRRPEGGRTGSEAPKTHKAAEERPCL